eukprot:3723955-Pyramimonas_sp.AAC.1
MYHPQGRHTRVGPLMRRCISKRSPVGFRASCSAFPPSPPRPRRECRSSDPGRRIVSIGRSWPPQGSQLSNLVESTHHPCDDA